MTPEERRRKIDPQYAHDEEVVSLADGYPIKLICQASLDDLDRRSAEAVPKDIFRPYLLITGGIAFEEDGRNGFITQDTHIRVGKPCACCILNIID